MKIKFVEAPPAKNQGKRPASRPKHYTIAKTLRENPGQWAHILQDMNTAYPTLIKSGGLVAFRPAGAFEAVSRSNGKTQGKNKGKADIYARYIGEPETEA